MAEDLKAQVCKAIDDLAPILLAASHNIHEHPELAFEEEHAAAVLAQLIEDAGLSVQREAFSLSTAYAASFGEGECEIAILSEYDALPGIGHACGHNIIAAAGLGAALGLAKLGHRLPGRVRYLGTPAEEQGGGKELMARAGAFDKVDMAMMVHPAGIDTRTVPSLCVSEVELVYHGLTAHAAAMPHLGINALDGVISAYQAVAQLRQHIRANERIHGIITDGGAAPNIVPDRAAAEFYIRAGRAEDLFKLRERVIGCFEAGAQSSGAKLELNWGRVIYLDVLHNQPLARAYEKNAIEAGREMFPADKLPSASFISTDMGNVSYRVPSIHPLIAVAPPHVSIHNPEFTHYAASPTGDKAVLDGAKAMAMTALDFMSDETLRADVKKDFAQQTQNAAQILDDIKNPCPHEH